MLGLVAIGIMGVREQRLSDLGTGCVVQRFSVWGIPLCGDAHENETSRDLAALGAVHPSLTGMLSERSLWSRVCINGRLGRAAWIQSEIQRAGSAGVLSAAERKTLYDALYLAAANQDWDAVEALRVRIHDAVAGRQDAATSK